MEKYLQKHISHSNEEETEEDGSGYFIQNKKFNENKTPCFYVPIRAHVARLSRYFAVHAPC